MFIYDIYTYPVEVHDNFRLGIFPKKLRTDTRLEVFYNTTLGLLHNLTFVREIDVEREYVPAEQFLAVTCIEPERGDLTLCTHRHTQALASRKLNSTPTPYHLHIVHIHYPRSRNLKRKTTKKKTY
jgi:hypothetical protein